jgi:intracellular multiplication protein IcmP
VEDKSNKMKPNVGRQIRDAVAPIVATQLDARLRDAEIEKIIAPYLGNAALMKPFLDVADGHAYTSTVLLRAFAWAKEEGVFASADILWLKFLDRPLWYVMNNVGRVAFHIEGAGVQAHFYYEMESRKPLLEAKVDNAVVGMEEYLVELGSNPNP